jgi:uncharacterized membrane protein
MKTGHQSLTLTGSSNYLNRYSLFFLVLIIALGAALRFYKLDFQSLWYDEIHSVNGADPDLNILQVIEYAKTDQPPAFFILLHLWFKTFHFNDLYARALVALIGVLGIIAMYFLGKEFKDDQTGFFAALLTSVNYFHINYSQEVRFYSLLFLGSVLSFLFFLKVLRNPSLLNLALYTASITLILYTHYFGFVVYASHAIIFLALQLFYGFDKKLFFRGLIGAVIAAILISPWVPQMLSDSGLSFWIQPVKFPEFLFAYFYNYFEDKVVIYLFAALLLYFVNKAVLRPIKLKENLSPQYVTLFGCIFLAYGIPLLYSVLVAPMLIVRYTIIALPTILLSISLAITYIRNRHIIVLITIIFLFFSLRSIFFIKDYYKDIRKQQWREVAMEVIKAKKERSVIFSYYSWHYNYYFKSLKFDQRSVYPPDVNYQKELSKVDYVWLIQGNEDTLGATGEEIAMIEKDFVMEKRIKLINAGAVLYHRKYGN